MKNATPVDRAGLTDVLEMGRETRWITVRVRPMASPGESFGRPVIGGSQDDEQEHKSQDDLGDDDCRQ